MFKMFKECTFVGKMLIVLAFASMAGAFIVPTVLYFV